MLLESTFYKKFSTELPKMNSDIYFSPLSMDGLEEMHRYSTDERLYEFFEFDAFKDLYETEAYMEKLIKRMEGTSNNKTACYWFVRRSTH